jgi:crotonobetainyl-CoA:carnitine CoA-transferase CaiB-like acyl-CoA transferase
LDYYLALLKRRGRVARTGKYDHMAAQGTKMWQLAPECPSGPLQGVRVLDLTTVVMGPSATQMLGDLGADVVKIETPAGDSMRWIGPWRHAGMGPMFLNANRNKRSIVLDLKAPEGKTAALALAQQADVLVTNVRPQGLVRLGLDYEGVRKANSRIIYCAAVGYGSGGPDSGKAVYDDLMQAASGIAGLFGAVDGTPRYAPINICDRVVGLYVANAITAALYHRAMTGEGQAIEVPMFETMAQFVLADHMGGAAFVPAVGEMGYRRLLSRTRGPYATKDGYLSLSRCLYRPALARLHADRRMPRSAGYRRALPFAGKPDPLCGGHRPLPGGPARRARQQGMARRSARHRHSRLPGQCDRRPGR